MTKPLYKGISPLELIKHNQMLLGLFELLVSSYFTHTHTHIYIYNVSFSVLFFSVLVSLVNNIEMMKQKK